jgi:hypothetical protein
MSQRKAVVNLCTYTADSNKCNINPTGGCKTHSAFTIGSPETAETHQVCTRHLAASLEAMAYLHGPLVHVRPHHTLEGVTFR